MSERDFEQTVERLMKRDLAAGTEAFRDDLLARCLAALGSEAPVRDAAGDAARCAVERADEDAQTRELPDSALELLAAAGPPYVNVSADTDANADPS